MTVGGKERRAARRNAGQVILVVLLAVLVLLFAALWLADVHHLVMARDRTQNAGDAAALAAALDRALEMPADEAAKMRAAAVESVRENFSTARMCERTLEFYSKIHSTLSHGNVI